MTASRIRQRAGRGGGFSRVIVCAGLLCSLQTPGVRADDAETAKALKGNGVQVTEVKGVVTAVKVSDGVKVTDEDFRRIGRLVRLRTLDLNNCLTDDRLTLLTGLAELEYLQTNLARVTDGGLKSMARLRSLRNVKFFHPGKEFSGAGLAHLADLPKLDRLTVAGSLAFNDDGMAAVAKLTGLQELRVWHTGVTDEGVKKLKGLKNLKSLYLGQRLSYKPPACPSDETLAILGGFSSLEALQLDEARLSLVALQRLKGLPGLKRLTLGGIDMPEGDVDRLKKELPAVKVERTAPSPAYLKRIRALFGG